VVVMTLQPRKLARLQIHKPSKTCGVTIRELYVYQPFRQLFLPFRFKTIWSTWLLLVLS
jgi:hypothetical protein